MNNRFRVLLCKVLLLVVAVSFIGVKQKDPFFCERRPEYIDPWELNIEYDKNGNEIDLYYNPRLAWDIDIGEWYVEYVLTSRERSRASSLKTNQPYCIRKYRICFVWI